MSSHPHEVPEGWTKGQPLVRCGVGRKLALRQHISNFCPMDDPALPDFIAYIIFDSEEAREAFLRWWCS